MDVLRLRVVGAVLRWPHVRLTAQLILLTIAVAIVLHGLLGPQIGPRNLATVLTSIHWRGLLVLGVLAAGNLFCAGCPMVLVRDAGRRLIRPRFTFPRRLRGKWIAAALLVAVLFCYELFVAWERPAATAWIVLGYFALALGVDLLFKGATFCKHVCPIGQFNFVASTMAPAELRVRDGATCQSCRTHDCIKGRRAEPQPLQVVRRGCELGLFLPGKVGNIDCTLCLDCVHACPHDNIGLITRVPGLELLDPRRRSGIGRLAARPDLAVLAIVFTFAALLSGFVMTAAAAAVERRLAGLTGLQSEAGMLGLLFVLVLGVAPALILLGAAALTRAAALGRRSLSSIALQYAPALIPLGFGVWLAHYGFHLLTGLLTIIPVTQSAAIDLLGRGALGEPAWRLAGISPGSVYPVQLGFVLLGACGSIGLVHGTSARDYPDRVSLTAVPWLLVVLVLAAAALWILGQPMQMRGVGGIG